MGVTRTFMQDEHAAVLATGCVLRPKQRQTLSLAVCAVPRILRSKPGSFLHGAKKHRIPASSLQTLAAVSPVRQAS